MTIMQIQIPDELKQEFEKAFPSERLEAVIERLLRVEIAHKKTAAADRTRDVPEAAARLREQTKPISNDEIRRLRHEGRR